MYTALRQHFEKIVPLTDEEFAFISGYFTPKKLKKHQFLVQEGNFVSTDFWVYKGLLKAYHTAQDGKVHLLSFAMEDWWISDYQAFFEQSKATLNIDCLEDTEGLCISRDDWETICAQLPKIEHFFRKKANRGYVALQRRILCLISSSAKMRYEQFLRDYPSLLQRIPKHLIASYLGVSRETLSRLM